VLSSREAEYHLAIFICEDSQGPDRNLDSLDWTRAAHHADRDSDGLGDERRGEEDT
jgi:hypothetical protein